ncbi:MAG: CHAD domain-containing protein [Hyphomonadaceae bacterium]
MTTRLERELKFELDSAAAAEDAARRGGAGARRVSVLESVYFDTPDLDLRARGLVFRVRRNGRRYQQTIKRQALAGGALRRWESERAIMGPRPELTAEDRAALTQALARGKKLTLEPVFSVHSERTTWLDSADGGEVEFALDLGEITAGGRSSLLCELEIELKRGGARRLFEAGRRIADAAGVHPTVLTKDDRGYRLLDDSWGRPARARQPALTPQMPAAEAFAAIAHECLHHFLLNEGVIRQRWDSEAIHQARIAVRRLRSALSFFAPIARGGAFEAIRRDLKWMSGELGAVRDFDVFLARIAAPDALHRHVMGAEALAHHFARRRDGAYAALAESLASERWRLALFAMLEWLDIAPWRRRGRDQTVAKFSDRRMRRRLHRLADDAADLAAMNDDALHEIRKKAKALRYAAEFHRALAQGAGKARRHRHLVSRLEAIQGSLGKQHDVADARALLSSLVMAEYAGGEPAMLFAAGHIAAEMAAAKTKKNVARAASLIRALNKEESFFA